MPRRCPKCGADVPSESLNCPSCYAELPREMETTGNSRQNTSYSSRQEHIGKRDVNHTISMILATIPALIGLLGLASIYRDFRDPRGWHMLVFGFVTYLVLVALVLGIAVFGLFGILLIIPMLLVGLFYLFLAFVNFMDAYTGSRFGKFGF